MSKFEKKEHIIKENQTTNRMSMFGRIRENPLVIIVPFLCMLTGVFIGDYRRQHSTSLQNSSANLTINEDSIRRRNLELNNRSKWIYSSRLDSIAIDFRKEKELHFIYVFDKSRSTGEKKYISKYKDAKGVLYDKLKGVYSQEKLKKYDLKKLLLSYLLDDIRDDFSSSQEHSYFEIIDVEERNIQEHNKINSKNIKDAIHHLSLLEHNNIEINYKQLFEYLKDHIEGLDERNRKTSREKFFSITIISDFDPGDQKSSNNNDIINLLNHFFPNCTVQFNLVVLPNRNFQSYKENHLLADLKKQVKNNQIFIFDLFGSIGEFNEDRVKENKTCLEFWVESIHTPAILLDETYEITPKNNLTFFPYATFSVDEVTQLKDLYISIIEGNENFDGDAIIKYQAWRLASDSIARDINPFGFPLQTNFDQISLNDTHAKCVSLNPNEAIKFERFSPRNPNISEADLYLKIFQKDEMFQFLVKLGFTEGKFNQ